MTSVGTASTSAPVSAASRLRGGVQPRRVDVGHGDPHALGREGLAQRETDPAGGAGDDGHLAVQLADHSFLKMSEPPAIIAIATPAPVTATMTSAVAGDQRVEAVPVVVVEDRAHHVWRRRAHEQRGGELVGEQDEHQRRGAAERRAHQRRDDRQVRPQDAAPGHA